jgi:hypothetical protein
MNGVVPMFSSEKNCVYYALKSSILVTVDGLFLTGRSV